MHVKIEDDNGEQSAYYGVSDFEVHDSTITVHPPIGIDRDAFSVDGTVVSGVDTEYMNEQGLIEAIKIDLETCETVEVLQMNSTIELSELKSR